MDLHKMPFVSGLPMKPSEQQKPKTLESILEGMAQTKAIKKRRRQERQYHRSPARIKEVRRATHRMMGEPEEVE